MNQVNIGSDNGMTPIWRQAIIWTNAGLLSIGPLGTNLPVSEISIKMKKPIIHENAFENTDCKMAAILYRERWVNSSHIWLLEEQIHAH